MKKRFFGIILVLIMVFNFGIIAHAEQGDDPYRRMPPIVVPNGGE